MKLFSTASKNSRTLFAGLLMCSAALLSSCASVDVQSYSAEKPTLDLAQYFNGNVDGWAVVTDRSGKVMKRFTVAMKCSWQGTGDSAVGTLDEAFTYSDGKKERRVWTIKKAPGGKYIGTAADVVGEAVGNAAGNALNWKYTLALPVDGTVYNVQFDDWLWLVDDKVLLNKAVMSKFGFKLAEVTISFTKR
jgi:Protein of unknown function (DUF3833)